MCNIVTMLCLKYPHPFTAIPHGGNPAPQGTLGGVWEHPWSSQVGVLLELSGWGTPHCAQGGPPPGNGQLHVS